MEFLLNLKSLSLRFRFGFVKIYIFSDFRLNSCTYKVSGTAQLGNSVKDSSNIDKFVFEVLEYAMVDRWRTFNKT